MSPNSKGEGNYDTALLKIAIKGVRAKLCSYIMHSRLIATKTQKSITADRRP
jgi:hypothetical protein